MEPTRYLKDITHLGINKYHTPSYHRINNSNDIYDYLYGNVGVSGKHSLPFHQAVNSIDNAGEKMYKRHFNYENMLRFDKRYNLDDRILDYANDRLMTEWKIIDNKFQKAQQAYESGNISENKFNRLSKKYERNAKRYNGYANNLNNNAKHFNIANLINDGRSVVTGKGPLYDSMTKGIWGLIGGSIGAGFAPVILPKVPWSMKNIVLPYLGGEVVNETTRKLSNNKYNSFGDFVYHNTPLSKLKDGTDSNIFVKGFSEMLNPAYLFPYGKAVKTTMDGVQSAVNAYNNLPVKIKFGPRENFRYRNIGDDMSGVNDLIVSGEVRPAITNPNSSIITKDFIDAFFGHQGKMVNPKQYHGKYFLGVEDVGNFFKKYRNQWGYVSRTPLSYGDVTINRRIFPKMTNSPYIEWAPGKYTEYNTPLKIIRKNGFFTPNTPDNGFRLYSGIPIKTSANNKSYQELVNGLRSEPFVINTNTVDDVLTFRRAVNSDDRFMAGVELKDRIGTLNKWNNYVGHGITKGPTEVDNWANLRALLKYGIDKNRIFFQAPLQKAATGEIHAGFGTASGTPYYDGPFVLVSPTSNPNNFTHVFINDSFENELGADLARRYKMMLQKEFPNIESLLYSEIK